jgi:O-antigen/teichoic acid export membrane protein
MDFNQILSKSKNFFLLKVVSIGSVFLFSIIVTRLYGSSIKGEVDLILAINNLFFAICSFSIASSLTLFVSSKRLNLNYIHLKLILLSSAYFFFCVLFLFLNYHFNFYTIPFSNESFEFYFLLILLLSTNFHLNLISAIISGQLHFYRTNIVLIVKNIIPILVILLSTILFEVKSINYILISIILGNIVGGIIGSGGIINETTKQPVTHKEVFKQGALYHIGNILQFFNYRLDVFILNKFVSLSQLAYYSLAVTISEALTQIPQLFSGMIFPLSSGDSIDKIAQLNRLIRVTVSLSFLASITIGILGSIFVPLFFGNEFTASLLPMYVLLIAFVLFSYCNIIAAFFAGRQLQRYNTYAALIGLSITIIGIYFIRNYAIIGAAIVSMASYSTIALFTIHKYLVLTNSRLIDIIPFRKLKEN